jgi:hypothetical protein
MTQMLPGTCLTLSGFFGPMPPAKQERPGPRADAPKAGRGRRVAGKAARGGRYGEIVLNRRENWSSY